MEKYVINGGKPLKGEVEISGAKNAAVAIIPAALMVDGVCRIENIPEISDTDMLLTILTHLGSEVRLINRSTIEIDSRNVRFCDAPFDLMRKIRASYYLIGALLGRFILEPVLVDAVRAVYRYASVIYHFNFSEVLLFSLAQSALILATAFFAGTHTAKQPPLRLLIRRQIFRKQSGRCRSCARQARRVLRAAL